MIGDGLGPTPAVLKCDNPSVLLIVTRYYLAMLKINPMSRRLSIIDEKLPR